MNKSVRVRHSILYHFVLQFVFMIILPTICGWWFYLQQLNFNYAKNMIETYQINMLNSKTILDSTLNVAHNIFIAVEGNQEILYYLKYYPNKSNMFYGTYKRVATFCDNLYRTTPYLNDLKIYSDSPLPIYQAPIIKMDKMVLEEELKIKLENAKFREIVWWIEMSDSSEFPYIYAYRKLYSENYLQVVGYVEIQFSPQVLENYFEMICNLSDETQAELTLYYGNTVVETTITDKSIPQVPEDASSEFEISLLKNSYMNCLKIPELNLCFVHTGSLTDIINKQHKNISYLFVIGIAILLLSFFFVFFIMMKSVFDRILEFSSFIQDSDSDKLQMFQPKIQKKYSTNELDLLINTYNNLIREKNSLISQVERMELLARDAKLQVLQEQIHPHFIFGTLETIRITAMKNKDKESADMIFSLASLIRFSMTSSMKPVLLRQELVFVEHYLKLQKIRYDERLDYSICVDKHLLDMKLPSLILQPILENAFVYGISKTLDCCTIMVEGREEETCVILAIYNTGVLITPQRLKEVNDLLSGTIFSADFKSENHGLALNNIKERLRIFFNGEASIYMTLQDNCTATIIKINK